MTTLSLEDAQASLPDLVHRLRPGDEVVITENDRPVARIVPAQPGGTRALGTLHGTVLYVANDFDAPLEDFKDAVQ
ncbi:MAG: type II toxin-antitoxin system prevent-host-death family antitoxin [Planctomycetia bacterium]|nr:type II toxin-antitoxin system prevent-host-death family antitoxin [Planctomycetia bacterium]